MSIKRENQEDLIHEILYGSGNWYRFPIWIFKIKVPQRRRGYITKTTLKPAVAFILASLLDQSIRQEALTISNGWFVYDVKMGEEQTGYNNQSQCDHIRTLEDCGLISRKRERKPQSRRLIKINHTLLQEALLEVESACINPGHTS